MMAVEAKNIPDLVKSCFAAFNSLSKSLPTRAIKSVAVGTWEDEAGRLRVWSGNLAAHQTGSASLSYRLRHAPSIKDEVIETLDVLLEALKEVIGILDEDEDEDSAEIDQEYVEELYEDVADSIEGLFRLTTIIRNPSRRDQLLERSNLDKTMEPFDKDYVRNKLHAASDALVDRLGRANTQRRANFRYLLRRHEKFSQGLDDTDENQGDTKSKMSSAIATEFPALSHIASTSYGVDNDDVLSVGVSETSYASSFFTETSRQFPSKPQPTTADDRFECPLCFYLVKANNIAAWRKHVLVDLQPYVCLFPDCSYGSKLFSSRREWFAHQVRLHVRPAGDLTECPLCKETMSSSGAEKHLGRHLEEVALFTLPPSLFDDDEEDEEDQDADEDEDELEIEGSLEGKEGSGLGDDTAIPGVLDNNVDEANLDDAQPTVAQSLTQAGLTSVREDNRNENVMSNPSKTTIRRKGNDPTEWDSSEAEQDSIDEIQYSSSNLQRRDIPAKAQAITPDNIDDIIATLSQMNIEQPSTTSAGNTNLISKFTRSRRPGSPSEPIISTDSVDKDTESNDVGSTTTFAEANARPSFLSSKSFEVIPYNEEYRNAILREKHRLTASKEPGAVAHLFDVKEEAENTSAMKGPSSSSAKTQNQQNDTNLSNIRSTKPSWSAWRDNAGDDSE